MYSERTIDATDELKRLEETIEEINSALTEENFYEGDRREVLRSREFFSERRSAIQRAMADHSITTTQQLI